MKIKNIMISVVCALLGMILMGFTNPVKAESNAAMQPPDTRIVGENIEIVQPNPLPVNDMVKRVSYQYEYKGMTLTEAEDSIIIDVDTSYNELAARIPEDMQTPSLCMYAFNHTTGTWELIGGWQYGKKFVWKPDANDKYTLVVYLGIHSYYLGEKDSKIYVEGSYWKDVDNLQIGKTVPGTSVIGNDIGVVEQPSLMINASESFYYGGITLEEKADSITMRANMVYQAEEGIPCYCMYAYNNTSGRWELVGGWQFTSQFDWKPDANDNYTVVIYPGVYDKGRSQIQVKGSYWKEVNRPQMGKKVLADCAVPAEDGFLYGCTSNVAEADSDYYTTCYIYSDAKKAWVAQARYQASPDAWIRTMDLEKGTYLMYNCTEKKMEDGSFRKLSCKYYLFSVR